MNGAKLSFVGALLFTLGVSPALAQSEKMVFVGWGGETQDLMKKYWTDPFAKQAGIEIIHDGPVDYGKLEAMVKSGNVTWDVVDIEPDFAVKACKEGLLEKIDYNVVKRDDLDSRFLYECGVGDFASAFVLTYNKDAFPKDPPKNWADLFDTKKFPGKRAFYKWSGTGVIEAALLADGVTPDKLFPLDLDRAFKKLDTIKKDIIWWGTGAESQQLLASGEASMGQLWSGRVFLMLDTANVGISWEQNIVIPDLLVVPKGSKHKETAMKLIAFATTPEPQALFDMAGGNSPNNKKAKALMSKEYQAKPFSSLQDQGIVPDLTYRGEHFDEIAKRWNAWQTK